MHRGGLSYRCDETHNEYKRRRACFLRGVQVCFCVIIIIIIMRLVSIVRPLRPKAFPSTWNATCNLIRLRNILSVTYMFARVCDAKRLHRGSAGGKMYKTFSGIRRVKHVKRVNWGTLPSAVRGGASYDGLSSLSWSWAKRKCEEPLHRRRLDRIHVIIR